MTTARETVLIELLRKAGAQSEPERIERYGTAAAVYN